MEVLKHGNTYKEKKCPKCGALLSYSGQDIQRDKKCYKETEHRWYYWEYIFCPECGHKIVF